MDFFAQQARVRRSSRTLVLLFALAVIAIIIAVDLVCAIVLRIGARPQVLVFISIAVLVLIGLCSAYRVASLSGGGSAVARGMDATPVPADTTNPQWKKLRNVIEEVAIASGVPVPEIWVMENESGINAFAAGYTPADAAVCVTQGCLDTLDRDELQGVIAHEFSHVLNGDMRLNIRLIGLLFGILAIGVIGRLLMYSGGGRRRNGGNVALAGLALFAIGYIGLFFGKLIQASVARARESLADASAVQFTRQTSGIAGALKKIAALAEGSQLRATGRDEVRHMLFGDADGSSLFATHPPILERIKALEPQFDGQELEKIVHDWAKAGGNPQAIEPEHPAHGWNTFAHEFAATDGDVLGNELPGFPPDSPAHVATAAAAASGTPTQGALPARNATLAIVAGAVAAQVGTPRADDYRLANSLHARIPDALAAAARDPRGALAVVFALTLSDQPDLLQKQLQLITESFDASLADAARNTSARMGELHPMLRLPLAQLAFPALKRRPRPELQRFTATLDALIRADDRVELDEYCLAKLVNVQVIASLDPAANFKPGGVRLHDAQDALRDLCALIAHFGNDDEDEARRAFLAAMQEALPDAAPLYAIPDDWQTALDAALDQLARVRPEGKELCVRALTSAIAADGKVSVAESEMLRVVCATLGCPLPPMLSNG